MHRIDTSTAQVDKFGAGKNGFTGGNPQTGELPTALDADFFDSVQEEIAAVIESAGIALDKSKNNQLTAAIKSLFGRGRFIGVQIITSSGTYTPTPGAKTGKARGVGGGGGGGGCPATSTGQQACAGGGLSGGYAEVIFDITSASYQVTIGAAGIPGTKSPTAGGDGGSTILSGVMTIPGGPGGGSGTASSSTVTVGNIGPSGVFPTITTGKTLISLPPAPGEPFITLGSLTQQQRGGRGGSNPFGLGGAPGSGSPGVAGKGYGAGGGGCSQYASNSGDAGGAGLPGILVIEEYA